MSRKNLKGRTKGGGKFVQLTHRLLLSDAWASLSTKDRCVYIAIRQTYDGSNNGAIGLGARRAGLLAKVSKNTATGSFAALIERGLIECATPGGFSTNSRRQSEWRLTDEKCDLTGRAGSWAYMKWRAPEAGQVRRKSKSQTRDTQVPNEGQSESVTGSAGLRLGPKRTPMAG